MNKPPPWKTKDGKRLVPWQMSTTHLWNALRMMEQEAQKMRQGLKKMEGKWDIYDRADVLILRDQMERILTLRKTFFQELSKRGSVRDINALVTYKRVFSPLTGQKPTQ